MLRPISVLLVATCLAEAGSAHAEPRDEPPPPEARTRSHGLAVGAGLGTQYAGVGGQLSYYLQVPSAPLRLAPHAALGVAMFLARDEQPFATATEAAAAFGLMGSWGRSHRLLLDVFYAPVSATELSLHGEAPAVALEWGPGLTVGYEYMADGGFFVRSALGAQYMVTAPIVPAADRIFLAATLVGLGYKLW